MKRKVLSILLSAIIAMAIMPMTASAATELKASAWAMQEVMQASEAGLIPDTLKAKDLTKPITREEFCELAIMLYERSTGIELPDVTWNPFTDTLNQEILKAYALEITMGTTISTFSPNDPVTREQCATFLFRTVKKILPPDTVYDVSKVPDFLDQKDISIWAADAAKYMVSLGAIKGDKGYFMPCYIPNTGKPVGYGQATREQAILMSVRTYDKLS